MSICPINYNWKLLSCISVHPSFDRQKSNAVYLTFPRPPSLFFVHLTRFREALGHPAAWNRSLRQGIRRDSAGPVRNWKDRDVLRGNPAAPGLHAGPVPGTSPTHGLPSSLSIYVVSAAFLGRPLTTGKHSQILTSCMHSFNSFSNSCL